LPYSVGFGAAYATATVFSVLAVANGSISLSALMISYSLILPTLYGLLFLHDPIGIGLLPGIALLMISLFLTNKKSEAVTITPKWLMYILLAFAGNGMCSIVQKMQQIKFDGAYKNEFMIMALIFVFISMGGMSLFLESKQLTTYAKKGWGLGVACGVMNGTVNLLVMILLAAMPASLMFPLITGGGVVVTYIISKLYYKERLSNTQLAGFILGILSVIILSM